MAGNFTQGKWDLYIGGYCHSLIGGNGMKAHIVWGENYPHEGKANANLFLNAREVLEALERCVSIMENGGTWSLEDQKAARLAIAKSNSAIEQEQGQ